MAIKPTFPNCPFRALVKGVETVILEKVSSGLYATRGMGLVPPSFINPISGSRQRFPAYVAGCDNLGLWRDHASRLDQAARAREWLRAILSSGPQPAREIFAEGYISGFSRRSLQRAKRRLRIASKRAGGLGSQGAWLWQMPRLS